MLCSLLKDVEQHSRLAAMAWHERLHMVNDSCLLPAAAAAAAAAVVPNAQVANIKR